VAAFRQHDEKLICVQSALNYFNAEENYLTRMFTLEYTYWFDYLLPGLDRLNLVIPLGGTSNHFRLNVLRELGGWDAFNVTEDAELGVRASVTGHRTGIIESTTYEEANKETVNWIRQRSRWIKGYMITWLVYNRNPLKLLSQLGLKRWFGFQLFVGGTSLIFLLNPIMWGLFVLWIVIQPEWIARLFNDWVWLLAALSLLFGNLMAIGLNALASLRRKQWRLFIFALTNPLYWSLHSVASYMALWQLVTNPFYWEKTNHGLTDVNPDFLLTKAGDNAKKSE
jgi:cellulose synthase/poly-beta-1,6-N-acetylglucosamine synthase-like glycosyltransferase